MELQFSQVEIASLYGCSARTIRRRILSYNLQEMIEFSKISDVDLDELVAQFVNIFPCAGQKNPSWLFADVKLSYSEVEDTGKYAAGGSLWCATKNEKNFALTELHSKRT